MLCVDKCSFLKREIDSNRWYCSLYNQNLLSENINLIYACEECYKEEIKILKEQLSAIYKIEDIIKRL
jgi:hypothetical protein